MSLSQFGICAQTIPRPGYQLKEYLGRGSYGEVWSATDTQGKVWALKFLRCDSGKGGRELRMLQKISQLKHPHLIHHHDIWCYQNHLVVAMELADGGLDQILQQSLRHEGKPLDKEIVYDCMSQAATALDFLNKRQHLIDGQMAAIFHCDIKPSNILLVNGQVKLTDFGLSLISHASTHTHSSIGTTSFAAPEVFQGRYSDRTDQYALAVTYCLLIGGQYPFPDSPQRFQREYVRPTPDLSMVPEAARPIVTRALAFAPANRWPSCSDFVDRLQGASTAAGYRRPSFDTLDMAVDSIPFAAGTGETAK
jgi:serine/threonine protein kinase